MSFRLQVLVVNLVVLVVSVVHVQAQQLVEYVPEDALVYVSWQGETNLGQGYEGSHLKALKDEPQMRTFVRQARAALATFAKDQPGDDGAQMQAVEQMLPLIWKYPAAMFISADAPQQPVVLLKPAADDRDTLLDSLKQLPSVKDRHASVTLQDGVIVIQAKRESVVSKLPAGAEDLVKQGAAIAESFKLVVPARNLSTNADYKQALNQALNRALSGAKAGDVPMVMFVNVKSLWPLMEKQARTEEEKAQAAQMISVMKAAGLDGVTSMLATVSFQDKNVVVDTHFNTPAKRRNMLALLDDQAITQKQLAIVPATATNVTAVRLDPAKLLVSLREAGDKGMPEQAGMVDQLLMVGSMVTGVNLQEDFINAMGPVWVSYSDPAMGGSLFGGGMGVVGELKDAGRMKQALKQFEVTAIQQLDHLKQRDPQSFSVSVSVQTIDYEGLEVHTVYAYMFAVSYTIADDKLFVAMSPGALSLMVKNARDTSNSITSNDAFKQFMKRVDGQQASMINYVDVNKVAPQGYQTLMFINQMINMGGASEHQNFEALTLPSLDVFLRHVSGAGSAVRADATGIHGRYVNALPGSEVLAIQGNAVVMSTLVGVALPALGAARRAARQMQSNTQARGIGAGCVLFLQGSRTPPDIAQLLLDNYFTAEYAISPTSSKSVPANFRTMTVGEKTQWIRQNASYIVVTKGMKDTTDPDMIFVFERPEDSGSPGEIAVCWGDNHTTREPVQRVEEILLKQTGLTMAQLTQMQEQGKR